MNQIIIISLSYETSDDTTFKRDIEINEYMNLIGFSRVASGGYWNGRAIVWDLEYLGEVSLLEGQDYMLQLKENFPYLTEVLLGR